MTETTSAGELSISVVIPVYNEELNVDELHQRIAAVLTSPDVEFLFVDDGSSDGTFARLSDIAKADPRVRIIRFRRNYGQTAALSAGIDHARGAIIVPMDGDLQNDPADIQLLLEQIEAGYDIVVGWRHHRCSSGRLQLPGQLRAPQHGGPRPPGPRRPRDGIGQRPSAASEPLPRVAGAIEDRGEG